MKIRIAIGCLYCALAGPAPAQTPASQPPPEIGFRYLGIRGDSAPAARILRVHVELAPGWHINSDAPLDEFLVPTSIEARAEGVKFGKPRFPKAERVHNDALGGDMLLFSGAFDIEIPAGGGAVAGPKQDLPPPRTRVTLRYQACDHATCFPPKEVAVER